MKKVKLSIKQVYQLEEILEEMDYKKDLLLDYHKQRISSGNLWQGYSELNGISISDMEKALYEGYDIEGENVHHYSLEQLQNAYKKPKNYESSLEELQVDIDYHLDGLGLAVKEENEQEIEYHKKQLKKLVEEMESKK